MAGLEGKSARHNGFSRAENKKKFVNLCRNVNEHPEKMCVAKRFSCFMIFRLVCLPDASRPSVRLAKTMQRQCGTRSLAEREREREREQLESRKILSSKRRLDKKAPKDFIKVAAYQRED